MKRFIKGFTLIELIIVMAILTVLMAAIMQMFKPIRSTYIDATLYENQRTAQNGIVQYLAESIRYSTDLGLYTTDKAGTAKAAVEEFTKAYLRANGVYSSSDVALPIYSGKSVDPDYDDKYDKTLEKMQCNADVIIIDNVNTYVYNNASSQGRILRRKFIDDGTGKNKKITDSEYANEKDSDKGWRLALGAPYYGEKNYTIAFDCGDPEKSFPTDTWTASDGISIQVTSASKIGRTPSGGLTEKGAVVTTAGGVLCKNQCTPINGMFDISNFTKTSSTGTGTKVYIVYINEKVKIEK